MKKDVFHNQRIVRIDHDNPYYFDLLKYFLCPNCKYSDVEEDYNYCPKCGYQINWKLIFSTS